MRKGIWLAVILVTFTIPQATRAQQASQSAQTSQQSTYKQAASQAKAATQTAPQATPAKADSLADAARKARAAEKSSPKAPKVFTNDNIPTASSGVSVVGSSPAASPDQSASAATAASNDNNEEAAWRQKFADARHKIEQDKQDLSLMQRELGELNVQYYTNPTQAMQQSYSRGDIIAKQNAIDAKQKELAADQQALSNLEEDLRKAGGDPAWSRE